MKLVATFIYRNKTVILAALFGTIVFMGCSKWSVPENLIGQWASNQKVTVLSKDKNSNFEYYNDTVRIVLVVSQDNAISGSIGGAKFFKCVIQKNRGFVGRKMKVKTDYLIKGQLKGRVFPKDSDTLKKISIPFDLKQNILEGSIFQITGFDKYPMVNIHLTRN